MKSVVIGVVVALVVLTAVGGGLLYYKNSKVQVEAPVEEKKLVVTNEVPAPGFEGVKEKVVVDATEEGGVQVLEVEASEFKFSPGDLNLKAGEPVKLTFNNVGKVKHNWVIEGTDVRAALIAGGETDEVEFTIEEPGEYTVFCSVPGHRASGMEATLVVE